MKTKSTKLRAAGILAAALVAVTATEAAAEEGWLCEAEICAGIFNSWLPGAGWTGGSCRARNSYVVRRMDEREKAYFSQYPHLYGEVIDWIAGEPGEPWKMTWGGFGCRQRGTNLHCRGPSSSIRMSIKTLRFLAIYESGYVEGDSDDAGPVMLAGTCQPQE